MSMEQHPLKSNSLKILKQVPTSKHKHQRPHNQQIPNHNQNNHREHTQHSNKIHKKCEYI